MKLCVFEHKGERKVGVKVEGGIADATGWLPESLRGQCLRVLLEEEALGELQTLTSAAPDFEEDAVRFLPPVLTPRRMICVGLNYDAHRKETGRKETDHPTLFVRWPSSVVGHRNPIIKPKHSKRFDFEGELAVIIGKTARHVPKEQAFDIIAGYSCFHDGSIRDYQRHTSQFTPGKNFDASGGFGPWLVTADEIGPSPDLALETRLNGQVVQQGRTCQFIFDIPTLIEYITRFTTLEPGDVIATGTPSGVGDKREPPLYLRPGATLDIEIEKVGLLHLTVEAEH